jgi:hypothetical protein
VYTVKLTVDGHQYTASLTVKMDPRVKTPPAGLQQQDQAGKQLARIMTHTTIAIREARSAQEQIEKRAHDASGPLEKKIKAALAAGGGEPGLISVNAEASALYGEIESADAAPTAAQSAALAKLARDDAAVMERWNKLKSTDLKGIQLSTKPAPEEDDDDSDVG